jgi:aspartate aminotransferase
MTIAKKIESFLSASSWIRKMFEEGARLKAEHGADAVFDFSLGNPNLPPPSQFDTVLMEAARNKEPGTHAYMPNTGYPHVRQAVADYVASEQQVRLNADDIIMTCGAAGGLNVVLKSILDPGDDVITPAPFFVEYRFYADNHGGNLVTVPTRKDFSLDIDAIGGAITEKTKAVLINSPNNPTGQIYTENSLQALGDLLRTKSTALDRTIYLIADEPYRKIVYDNAAVPSVYAFYDDSIVVTSYSKDISIPGERLGYIAVSPAASGKETLIAGMALANRILGFVNAPALMQRVVGELQGAGVDIGLYARNRELLCDGLSDCGYDIDKPAGAFYLFPKAPIADDVKFVQLLQEELVLTVPGSGFGGPGHFRISYCVDPNTIINAMPGFKKGLEKARG